MTEAARPITASPSRWSRPGWAQWSRRGRLVRPALIAFAAARVFDLLLVAVVARRPSSTYARGDVAGALSSWDGRWYQRITQHGYPSVLPTAPDGRVRHTALAFFPAYPGIVAALRAGTGLGFVPIALAVALLAGAVAAAGIPLLLEPYLGRAAAVRAGVLWACSPVSAVLVLTYSDGLFAAEAVLFLVLLVRGRHRWLLLLVPVMGLTRGVLLPFAAVLAVYLWRRRGELVSRSQRVLAALGVLGVVASSALWPGFVALRIGRWDAYLRVQQAWQPHLQPLRPWAGAVELLGAGSTDRDIVVMTAFVCAGLALACLTVGLPAELSAFAIAYLAYIVVLVPPTPSFLRFTVPLITLAAAPAVWLRGRVAMGIALLGCLLAQVWWVQAHLPYLPAHHLTP